MQQLRNLWEQVIAWLEAYPTVEWTIGLTVLLLVAYAADVIAKRVLLVSVGRLVKHSRTTWDDALHHHRVFERAALFVPIYLVHAGTALVPGLPSTLAAILQRLTAALIALIGTRAIASLLRAINTIYDQFPTTRTRPIKGYLQIVVVAVYVVGTVLVIAALLGKSPLIFLSGLGAMTAVLLLVFRDTILSLVANIQLAGNDMVQVGDWIEMPSAGADGDVIDIALHTVKVQNWDKTISTIPTYRLITESFKNWRGMSSSGGRRIKRSIFIDQGTVRCLSDEEVERFKQFALLKEYVEAKQAELTAYNQTVGMDGSEQVNLRRLTNVGSPSTEPDTSGATDPDLRVHQHHGVGGVRRHHLRHLRPHPGHCSGVRFTSVPAALRCRSRQVGTG